MEQITINVEDLGVLVEEGGKLVATPEAEEFLVKLLLMQSQVDDAIKRAAQVIEEKALELNPNFSSIRSDLIKVAYKTYGAKYTIDDSKLQYLPKEVYKTTVKHTVDTKALENYTKEHDGMLPDGILVKDRKKSMSIKLVNAKEETYE